MVTKFYKMNTGRRSYPAEEEVDFYIFEYTVKDDGREMAMMEI